MNKARFVAIVLLVAIAFHSIHPLQPAREAHPPEHRADMAAGIQNQPAADVTDDDFFTREIFVI